MMTSGHHLSHFGSYQLSNASLRVSLDWIYYYRARV